LAVASKPDPVLFDDWHVVADRAWLKPGGRHRTALLGVALDVSLDPAGEPLVRQARSGERVRAALS
jgi:hypothetical protein